MREFTIQLKSVQEVQTFVGLATSCAFPVQVVDDSHRVNGKSFMEMFCLNLTQPLTVRCQCGEEEFQQFCRDAEGFLVK